MNAMNAKSFDKETARMNRARKFAIDETYWGYIVRSTERRSTAAILGNALCYLFGVSMVAAAAGFVLLPSGLVMDDALSLRLALSVCCLILGWSLILYAHRSGRAEFHVDTARGELREVVRNHRGGSHVTGRYGFDAIGGAFIDRSSRAPGGARLVLRYRNTSPMLEVAKGHETQLSPLRDRVGRDLMLHFDMDDQDAIAPVDYHQNEVGLRISA